MSTAVRIVYETRANETGMYTFFFRTIPEKSMTARLEMETGGAVKEMEAKVLDGKSVRLDWLSE